MISSRREAYGIRNGLLEEMLLKLRLVGRYKAEEGDRREYGNSKDRAMRFALLMVHCARISCPTLFTPQVRL